MVRDSQGWEDAALLAGPGFRDVTRLASGDPTMARDIMLPVAPSPALLDWAAREGGRVTLTRDPREAVEGVDCVEAELETIRKALESGAEPVYDLFYSTQLDRDTFIQNPPQRRRPEGAEPPSARDAIGRMFVGGLYDKIKEASDRLPAAPRDDRELKRKLGIEDERP